MEHAAKTDAEIESAYEAHLAEADRLEKHYANEAKACIARGDWETARLLGFRVARECNEDAKSRGLDITECIRRSRAIRNQSAFTRPHTQQEEKP